MGDRRDLHSFPTRRSSDLLWKVVDGPFLLTQYDASDGGATVVPNPDYSGPVKSSLKALVLAPFTTDASEFAQLQSGTAIDIGYVTPQDLPVYKGKAFGKNGVPLVGANNTSLASRYDLVPTYPWGVSTSARPCIRLPRGKADQNR